MEILTITSERMQIVHLEILVILVKLFLSRHCSYSRIGETTTTPEFDDPANSEVSVEDDMINQLDRHLAPKYYPPHVQPFASSNTPAALSDEELALLLHQELDNSPKIPRVP